MNIVWLDKEKMSHLALTYCLYIEDNPRIRKYIIISFHAFIYCKEVKDRSEVRKNIINPIDAHEYCRFVRNDIQWLRDLGDYNDNI